jgi:membrane protease YdiL (CAAX protease family)
MMHAEANHMIASKDMPWGMWATIGFGLVVGAIFILLQVLLFEGFVAVERTMKLDIGVDAMSKNLRMSGFFIAVATFVTTPLCICFITLLVRLRRSLTVKQYLGLNVIAPKTMLLWLGMVTLFALISDCLTRLLGRPLIPDFMVDVYTTAYFAPLFWIAIVVAVPLFEEVFFRGFLFEGFRHSKLGPIGAVLLTSLAWTVLHVQYGAYELGTIFILGVVFGAARLKTRSIYPPIAMHSLFNLFAMIQLVASLGSAGEGVNSGIGIF